MHQRLTDRVPDARGKKPDWRPRKELYLAHIKEADCNAVLVSTCDKLHNALAIADDYRVEGDRVFKRFSQPKSSTVWYYRELATVISDRLGSNHALVGKLNAALARWAG